jgi:uncharacterized RDD family membrane protein YckC
MLRMVPRSVARAGSQWWDSQWGKPLQCLPRSREVRFTRRPRTPDGRLQQRARQLMILFLPFAASMGMRGMMMGRPQDLQALFPMIHAMLRLALLRIVLHWLYYSLLESSAWQATLGKKALGLEVTDLDGNRIGFGRATGRFFAKFISWIILLIGYIMAGFTEKKQALHDILAGTLVIRKL